MGPRRNCRVVTGWSCRKFPFVRLHQALRVISWSRAAIQEPKAGRGQGWATAVSKGLERASDKNTREISKTPAVQQKFTWGTKYRRAQKSSDVILRNTGYQPLRCRPLPTGLKLSARHIQGRSFLQLSEEAGGTAPHGGSGTGKSSWRAPERGIWEGQLFKAACSMPWKWGCSRSVQTLHGTKQKDHSPTKKCSSENLAAACSWDYKAEVFL